MTDAEFLWQLANRLGSTLKENGGEYSLRRLREVAGRIGAFSAGIVVGSEDPEPTFTCAACEQTISRR